MSTTVKKQHYIWRKYLKNWLYSENKLYVLRKEIKGNQDRIEERELEKIGFEKYFYDTTGFCEDDVSILQKLLEHMQKKDNIKFAIKPEVFFEAASQRDFIEKEVICQFEGIDNKWNFIDKLMSGDTSFYEDSQLKKILNKLKKCIVDNIFLGESKLNCENEEIVASMNDIENEDLKYQFNRFFCMQYFRSPRIQNNQITMADTLKAEEKVFNTLSSKFLANFLMVYFAEKMAMNITYRYCNSIVILINNTSIPFITSDTPVINLTGKEFNGLTVFYYPISPQIAIKLRIFNLMCVDNKLINNGKLELGEKDIEIVKNLNKKMISNCYNEVYSNNKEILE